jgi:redox-sensitive bicupin YhaK (pirin superfamily)
MITIRRSAERGHFALDWLDSRHSFSFGSYRDPAHMGFGALRVINDDRIAPGGGFATHPHRDMEIVTYVLDGALAHRDSLGNGSIIARGDVQRMSAGTGIEHSEFNASSDTPVHLLQLWIIPEKRGLTPSYEQKTFPEAEKRGRLRLVASRGGRDGSVAIHRDVDLYAALLSEGERVRHELKRGRTSWVQVAQGAVSIEGELLREGDGAAVENVAGLEIIGADGKAEALLFDLGE